MGNSCRCPGCNKFGSSSLGGFCRSCAPAEKKEVKPSDENDPGYVVRDHYKSSYGFQRSDSFLSDEYGIRKSTYGYQERGRK